MLRRLLPILLLVATPAFATGGMVSAADPRAAEAGREMLRAGGSAADAAMAMMLALTVVEPQSSGIGGGGFMLYRDAAGAITGYDGRETAPKAADGRWFYRDGRPLGHKDAVPGGRSVGVPGNLRLMALAHRQKGRLPWARLFQPAIRLARDGFAVTPRLNRSANSTGHLAPWATGYLRGPDGQAKPVGTVLKNPGLAALLTRVAKGGPDAFYAGPTAKALVAAVNGAGVNPSAMTLADIAAYRAKERPVPCGTYRGWRICSMGPPSSGAVLVLQILGQIERFDMKGLGATDPRAWHLIAESMRLAYADRNLYVGDPDFVAVPMKGLLDPGYIASRSALIAIDRTMPTVAAGTPPGAPPRVAGRANEVPSTTHFVAIDGKGAVATMTSTVEGPFGSGLAVDGMILNNELTDFDTVPDKDGMLVANRVEGGKRPRSSMAPTLVFAPDRGLRVAIGAAGGSTIPAQVAKALVAMLDWGMTAQAAIALPLVYAPGDTVLLEKDTSAERLGPALTIMGHKVASAAMPLKANAIERVDGRLAGAADPRSEGVALAE